MEHKQEFFIHEKYFYLNDFFCKKYDGCVGCRGSIGPDEGSKKDICDDLPSDDLKEFDHLNNSRLFNGVVRSPEKPI